MTVLIADQHLAQRLIEERRARGIDRPDEVWDGVYIVMPPTDNVRQELVAAMRGKSSLEAAEPVGSDVLPLTWRLTPGEARPRIEVTHTDGRQWVV